MVKVLQATMATQGDRADDFCWTVPGELVMFGAVDCDSPSCGCGRCLVGLGSSKSTTTFEVVDRDDLDADTFTALVTDSLERSGWYDGALAAAVDAQEMAVDVLVEASSWPAGTVLGLENGGFYCRRPG